MKTNTTPNTWEKVLSFLYRILITPPMRIVSIVFSHGLTHFFALLITGFITGWLFFDNSTIDIKPHHIGIDLQWTNKYFALGDEGDIPLEDSIRDLDIHIELNSNDAFLKTDGKYKNRLVLEFEGNNSIIQPHNHKNGNPYPVFAPITQGKEDSIMIKVYSNPILSDASIVIIPENSIYDKSFAKKSWSIHHDSTSILSVSSEETFPYYMIPNPDSTRYVYQYINNDSVLTIKMIPAKYDVYGKMRSPRQTVNIYSNNFGVDEDNPYYYYFIAIPSSKLSGSLKFDFKASDLTHPDDFNFSYAQNSHLQYNYVFPQPDIINNGYIEYHTKEKIEAIKKNHGVIIQAVDVKSLNHLNNLSFLYSVLAGTCLAFVIDIFIQLIRELRRVNIKHKKTKS